jgi:hypothetical protein
VVSVVVFVPSFFSPRLPTFAPFTLARYIVTVCDDKATEQHITVWVTLWLTVDQSVPLGVNPPFGVHGQILVCLWEMYYCWSLLRCPLWGENGFAPSLFQCHVIAVFVYMHIYIATFSNIQYTLVLYQHRLCTAYLTLISLVYVITAV